MRVRFHLMLITSVSALTPMLAVRKRRGMLNSTDRGQERGMLTQFVYFNNEE